ncbi:MAG: N-acetyltransferase [Chloroflexi bacterium]|nr:N-acetyltransferase [Chloroflexota bacterium]
MEAQRVGSVTDVLVRRGRESDLARINEIYNHYVLTTAVTFDIEPITMEQRRAWFARYATDGRHRLFVAEHSGAVLGYADSHQFRAKQAYDTTVETTVYCAPEAAGRGIGRQLYDALFDALRGEDVRAALAGMTLPNEASKALHERFDFALVGVMHEVGKKFDRYWDVAWYEKRLGED